MRSIAIERAEIESVQEDKKVEEEILNRNIKLERFKSFKRKKYQQTIQRT